MWQLVYISLLLTITLHFTRDQKENLLKNQEVSKYYAHDCRYIYRNEIDKVYFKLDMAYEDFKDLPRRTAFENVLQDKAFKLSSDPKYD